MVVFKYKRRTEATNKGPCWATRVTVYEPENGGPVQPCTCTVEGPANLWAVFQVVEGELRLVGCTDEGAVRSMREAARRAVKAAQAAVGGAL